MTLTESTGPNTFIYLLAGLNVASFFLGMIAAAVYYRPKIRALVEGAKKHAEECVNKRMDQLKGMFGGLKKPEPIQGRRIELPPERVHGYLRLLDDIQKPSGAYLFWYTMGEDFPETKVGNWRVDTTEALKPVLIQLIEPPTEPAPVAKPEQFEKEGHAY